MPLIAPSRKGRKKFTSDRKAMGTLFNGRRGTTNHCNIPSKYPFIIYHCYKIIDLGSAENISDKVHNYMALRCPNNFAIVQFPSLLLSATDSCKFHLNCWMSSLIQEVKKLVSDLLGDIVTTEEVPYLAVQQENNTKQHCSKLWAIGYRAI